MSEEHHARNDTPGEAPTEKSTDLCHSSAQMGHEGGGCGQLDSSRSLTSNEEKALESVTYELSEATTADNYFSTFEKQPVSPTTVQLTFEEKESTPKSQTDSEDLHIVGAKPQRPSSIRLSNSPRSNKRVQFADQCGLNLEKCKRIYLDHSYNLPDLVKVEHVDQSNVDVGQCMPSGSGYIPETSSESIIPPLRKRPNFVDSETNLPAFIEKIDSKGIGVECAFLTLGKVFCTVRARIRTDEKCVFVRHTFDQWKTHQDMVVCRTLRLENEFDFFNFEIDVPLCVTSIEFAICQLTESGEYWDNNDNNNFVLERRWD